MNYWQAIIFGIIQGMTEFLPVSSTGHLVLTEKILGTQQENLVFYFSMLHLGTLIAVFIVMRKEILGILKNLFGKLTWLLVIATIPAVIAVLFLEDLIDAAFGGKFLWAALIVTGLILFATFFIKEGKKTMSEIGWLDALLVGIAQAIAITPGISRSGSCMVTLMGRGIKREDAIRFAFLMSIPAILGSFVMDILDIVKGDYIVTSNTAICTLIGVVASAIVGYFTMSLMIKKLTRKGIIICAAYVILLGVAVALDQYIFHIFM
jgi:undecaprenyl-diphosphatase